MKSTLRQFVVDCSTVEEEAATSITRDFRGADGAHARFCLDVTQSSGNR